MPEEQEQIQYLMLTRIGRDPDQPRREFDPEAEQGMALSLREVGQLSPIRVRMDGEQFIIVDGERRFRSAKLAGFTSIAAIVEGKQLCAGEILQKQLVANCQREDLSRMEKALAIDRLMQESGWNGSTIAGRLGMSVATVSKLLSLLQLPEPIQRQVHEGQIGLTAAMELRKVDDGDDQAAFATEVAAGRLTRDALAGTLRSRRNGRKQKGGSSSRATATLGPGRAVTVIEESIDMESYIEVLEELLNKARKARTSGVELRTFLRMLKDQSNA